MSESLSDFSRIRLLWPDHFGLARGKYLPGSLADRGTGFCVTTFGLAYDREIIDAPHAGLTTGLSDVFGMPEVSTLRPSWEDDRTGVAMTGLTMEGEPYPASSRSALERAVADWADLGYQAKVGLEFEGYLLAPTGDGGWERYSNPRSMVYGTGRLGDSSGFMDEVMAAADRCGFVIESANVEFDESQFEFTLRYDDALRAVDDAFVFRVLVRETALALGLDFTFMGKPFPAVSGSGTHINFSLTDASGAPAMADEADPHGVSELGRRCLGGLTKHHRGLTALTAPTINAYRRLQPGMLAGCWGNWGVDHRNVANRVPAEGGPAMRIENRIGDGSMNLHLGVAAVLQAARLGEVNSLVPPPAYTGDGFEDGGADDVARSASDLGSALDDLEADSQLSEAMGTDVVEHFLFMKRHEVATFEATGETIDGDELTGFELANYLPYH